ncbi:hypothetical protein [Corynebacterium gerontici]|uniref:Uncharacterized protein n=1 Tax=Corynebacterium gerontici TaxID=2079234 RepID=A0A3G6J356_9CORY|nr:hypothetical protein [Corynebacterium gerontici]AZA12346.1 hypothetical protein CGERO_10310 [Corynebacterium gerontici]
MFTSFLLIDAHAPALTRHRQRLAAYGPLELLDITPLHTPGAWHPKIAWDGQRWDIQMRPARPREVVGHINHAAHDQRCAPTTKGPDIPWLESTLGPGRSESLLIDAHGRAIESTYSSLIAFEGSTAWYSNHTRALPSTTLPGALQVLRDAGFNVRDTPGFEPGWLWGRPALMLNAFHGAREVYWGQLEQQRAPISAAAVTEALWMGAENVEKLRCSSGPRTRP